MGPCAPIHYDGQDTPRAPLAYNTLSQFQPPPQATDVEACSYRLQLPVALSPD